MNFVLFISGCLHVNTVTFIVFYYFLYCIGLYSISKIYFFPIPGAGDRAQFMGAPPGKTQWQCYHGSAMSVAMIRCRRSYYKEQWMGIGDAEEDRVNHGMDRPVDVVIVAHIG